MRTTSTGTHPWFTPWRDTTRGPASWVLQALGSTLRADRVDLVMLNDAPPKLAFQIMKHGVVVFARDPVELHRFRVRTYSRHADYQPLERLFREATKRRVVSRVNDG